MKLKIKRCNRRLWSMRRGFASRPRRKLTGRIADIFLRQRRKPCAAFSLNAKIDSARAVMFLLDDQGKVVGQATRWVIGGTKDKPPLAPDAKTTYNFVVPTDKPFTKTKVSFNRVILEGGKTVDLSKDVSMEDAKK
jgi:hypothetical protein